MDVILGVFTLLLTDEKQGQVPKDMVRQMRLESIGWFVAGGLFLLSAHPAFFRIVLGRGLPLRYDLWVLGLLPNWIWLTFLRVTGHRNKSAKVAVG
jgi:hypothetical protein